MNRRMNLRGQVKFPVIEREGRISVECRSVNISTSGILLEHDGYQLDHVAEAPVELELHLPNRSEPLRLRAISKWSRGNQRGLSFDALPDADRLTLAEELDTLYHSGAELS